MTACRNNEGERPTRIRRSTAWTSGRSIKSGPASVRFRAGDSIPQGRPVPDLTLVRFEAGPIDELAHPPITTVTVATRAESSVEVATKVMDTGAAKT